MNRFIATLTAIMTLSHAVVGCRAEPVHAVGCHEADSLPCYASHQHGPSYVGDSHQPLEEHTPTHDQGCCRVKCQWLAPSVLVVLSHELLGYATIFNETQSGSAKNLITFLNANLPAAYLFALPVRSHLALGVLLI